MLPFSSHPTTGPGWGETFISLHQLPGAADTTDCYGNPGDVEQGTLPSWEAPATPRKGSHRRRSDVVRLGWVPLPG